MEIQTSNSPRDFVYDVPAMELREYLQELNKVQLLQPAEEQRLWLAFKRDEDAGARRQLIEAYQPLVFKQALPFGHLDHIMDVIQEGTVGLIEAVEGYDPERGVAFSLYAVHRIRGRMLNFLQREGRSDLTCMEGTAEVDASLQEQLVDPALPVAEQAEASVLADQLHLALARLPEKERLVLERVYLHSEEAREVADVLQVSTSHIYRLQKSGIRRVRGMLSRFMQYWQ